MSKGYTTAQVGLSTDFLRGLINEQSAGVLLKTHIL